MKETRKKYDIYLHLRSINLTFKGDSCMFNKNPAVRVFKYVLFLCVLSREPHP